jgi:phosphate transport system ATP-binding protein
MISVKNISVYYYNDHILRNINIDIEEFSILAVIGPANSGKSTFLKLFNRLDEIKQGFRVSGALLIDEENLFKQKVVDVRRRSGFVFSKPQILPGTVFENLVFGLRIQKIKDEEILKNKLNEVLRHYELTEYFMGIMDENPSQLSMFKQQLISLVRVLVLNPDIILFNKPTKHLSEIATSRIEAIIYNLKKRHTIIINASNLGQARRISNYTAFIYNGNIIEHNSTNTFFTKPERELTANYIRGRFDL